MFGGKYWNSETRRYPAALLVGLAWACAFPQPGWAGLAWVVPGALFWLGVGLPGAGAFRVGFVAGCGHSLVSLRWLLLMPHWAGSVAGWLALSGYCALYAAVWNGLAQCWVTANLRRSSEATTSSLSWSQALRQLAEQPWLQRALWWSTLAAIWVALEMIRARLFTGFAWNFLGASHWRQIPLIQLASVTGVYGLSFLICWFSLALGGAVLTMVYRPKDRWGWTTETRLPLLFVMLVAAWGFWTALGLRRQRDTAPRTVRVALVQPAVPQTLQWDARADAASFARIFDLSAQALALKPDLLVWPEGAFGLGDDTWSQMTNLTRSAGVSWIFNTTAQNHEGRPVNSAVWLDPRGQFRGQYDKQRLVLFGEYVPLERWLPFLKYLTPIGSSFAAGSEPVVFSMPLRPEDPRVEIAPIICFEDTFPQGVPGHVRSDTDFLLEITNDAWFGESSAQWQHAANSAFRAVENGLPLVRAANNGLTLWFDAAGIPHDVFGETVNPYRPGFQIVQVPVGVARVATFYHRRGDVFGWTCVAWSAWALLKAGLRRRVGGAEGIGKKAVELP